MKIYFGGIDRPDVLHTLKKYGGRYIMLTYARPPSRECWQIIRQNNFKVLLDSGAFSQWQGCITINPKDYMAYIKKHNIKHYFNLDCIGNHAITIANQKKMEQSGFNPIPIFHYGTSWSILDRLAKHYPLVGLGGTVGQAYTAKQWWLEQIFSRYYPQIKFHGLGITDEKLLKQFPFFSIDSTWWLFRYYEKQRRLAPGRSRKSEQIARIKHLLGFQHITRQYQTALTF